MWKVTAGRGNVFAREFLERGYVAIGWSEAGDYTKVTSREALTMLFRQTWPGETDKQVSVGANQVWRFLTAFKVGDNVLTYDSVERFYHVGTISGEPVFDPSQNDRSPVQRAVHWDYKVSRDSLSQGTRNTLGAIMTVFLLSQAAAAEIEICRNGDVSDAPSGPDPFISLDSEEIIELDPFARIENLALERVKDRLVKLNWEEMQEIVAALLRSLGYRTMVSPNGPDRGKDIIASRDGFGFERPRIVVEVKHRRGQMGAQEIRSFLGGRHQDDRGLYVSTGGFSRDAHYEAERASTVTHLMSLDELAGALIQQYDSLDEEGRRILPLTKIYWPA